MSALVRCANADAGCRVAFLHPQGDLEIALYQAGAILKGNVGSLGKIGFSRTARTDKGVSAAGNIFAMK